jgi:hypothetical protein
MPGRAGDTMMTCCEHPVCTWQHEDGCDELVAPRRVPRRSAARAVCPVICSIARHL